MSIAPGATKYAFADPRPGPAREIVVHAYRPASFTRSSPIVVVIAGRKRNADEYRDFWIPDAERRGLLVVAPEFDEAQYAHPYTYNYCGMCRADGTFAPREEWIFPVIEAIFRDAKRRVDSTRERYFLSGHSAGAQLVHRMVMFGGTLSYERAVAGNAGSYTLPVGDEDFPFGLRKAGLPDAELRAMFSRPLEVHLGDRDIDPNDEHLPREPAAMRQGPHRFARGRHFMETALAEARRLGVPFRWSVGIVPGVAHSGQMMAPFAARAFFD
ncbi:MAG TPA: hypothetical protein VMG61_00030 [Usitatibacter sp.]|nr:hypothetical protein [Usitatibacter sp.]